MIINKIIETGLNIQHPIDVYVDSENNIRNLLIDMYEGKCFRSCFIVRVLEIKNISECVMDQRGGECVGKVSVQFEVEAVVYAKGEVINGCKVVQRDRVSDIIIASSKYGSICLNSHVSLANIQKDQMVSVRVGEARYNIGSTKISINAYPYLSDDSAIVFKTIKELSSNDMSSMSNDLIKLSERTKEEERKIAAYTKENPRGIEFFKKLLYTYKEEKPEPAGIKVMKIEDLYIGGKALTDGYYVRDPVIYATDPIFHQHTEEPTAKNMTIVEVSPGLAERLLLENYYSALVNLREMLETYNTADIIKEHMPWWRVLKHNKIE